MKVKFLVVNDKTFKQNGDKNFEKKNFLSQLVVEFWSLL